jgi:hypothetical protein
MLPNFLTFWRSGGIPLSLPRSGTPTAHRMRAPEELPRRSELASLLASQHPQD